MLWMVRQALARAFTTWHRKRTLAVACRQPADSLLRSNRRTPLQVPKARLVFWQAKRRDHWREVFAVKTYGNTFFVLDLDLDLDLDLAVAADAGDATDGRDHHCARRLAHRVYRDWGVSECITLDHQVRARVR